MNTNTKNEINFLLKPVIIFSSVLILIIFSFVIGLRNISNLQSNITANKTTENTLSKKVLALETVSRTLPGDVTFLDVVLPSKGSVLYALSQIRTQSLNNNLNVSNLKTGNVIPESSGVMKSSVSFEVEGQESDVFTFLSSLGTVLPLINIDKVSFNSSLGLSRANISVNVYSAELPKTIPSLTGVVSELTSQDITLLNELAGYTLPQFIEPTIEEAPSQKTDPFN
ncbi:MAG: hypothetical protein QY322_00330 [bacterium]|nr:MAG: hypothetical protein QY322_00330 [bacterium]